MSTFNFEDLQRCYEEKTASVACDCSLVTEMVGGVPANEDALRAFVTHHYKLTDPAEIEKAVARIQNEELGKTDQTPELGELKEEQVYGVNMVRRTALGPYIGDWMIKACLKQAASRLNVFVEIRGSKGNFSEAGRVRAYGESDIDSENPNFIYLRSPEGGAAKTYFQKFMGRVSSPQGSVSIVHTSECVAPKSRFGFEFRFLPGIGKNQVKEQDIKDVLALAMIVGLGSVKALERGKFKIERATINLEVKESERKAKAAA